MATSPSRSRVARSVSLATLAVLCLVVSSAMAGSPATLDDSAPPKPAPAAADTSRKSTKKPAAPTAPVSGAVAKPAPKAPAKPGTTTQGVAKSTTAPAKAAPAKATPAKSGEQPIWPTTSKTTPAKPSNVAKVAPAPPSKTSPVPSKTAAVPPVKKTGAPVPTGIARVAPPPSASGTTAKVPSTKPGAPTGIARIPAPPAPPGSKVVAASKTGSVTRLTPTSPGPIGSTLAKSGGTTVTGPSVTPIKPGAAGKAGARGAAVAIKPTPGTKAGSPLAAKGGATVSAALEDHVTYQYNALGRRDPFQSLMEGDWVGNDVGGDAPPDLGGLKLVGVVWGRNDQFAMVEDPKGGGYVLRRGDRVMNGYVEGLKRDAMIVNITVDGQSQSVTIPITRKGDKSNASR